MLRSRLAWVSVVALFPLAGMAIMSACGGDNNTNNDAGPDVTTSDVAKDVTPDVVADAGSDVFCLDADLVSFLPSADASIDVEAGINITQCTGCLKTQCGSDITACNKDCTCQQDIIDAVQCVAQGGDFTTCAGGALTNTNAQNLFICALGNCSSVCIPPDGGTKDSGTTDGAPQDSGGGG